MLTKNVIENLLIIAGESFWISAQLSQLLRLRKTKNKRGLSAVNQTLDSAGNIAWVTYFVGRHLWVPATTNVIMLSITLALLGFTLTNRRQFYKGVISILIIGPLTGSLLIRYPSIGGWLGVSYNTVATFPWLNHVLRTKKSSGISVHNIVFRYAAITSTLIYGILVSAPPLITGCLLGVVYTTIISFYYRRYRHNN